MATRIKVDISLGEEDLRRDPILLEVPGLGEFEFPGVMNALATVRVSRWEAAGRTDALTPAETIALLGDLVPDDILTEWSRRGFDMFDPDRLDAVEAIITALMTEYRDRAERMARLEGRKAGKAPDSSSPLKPPPYTGTGITSAET